MKTKHRIVPEKHRPVAHAWVDGAEIEFKTPDGRWLPAFGPHFCDKLKYRVKPKPPVVRWKWVILFPPGVLPEGQTYSVTHHYLTEKDVIELNASPKKSFEILQKVESTMKEFSE